MPPKKLDTLSNLALFHSLLQDCSMFRWLRRPKPEAVTDPQLLQRVAALEKRLEVIDLEWSDWFGKFRRLYAQISKRAKAVEQAEEPEAPNGSLLPRMGGRTMNPLAAALLRRPGSTEG